MGRDQDCWEDQDCVEAPGQWGGTRTAGRSGQGRLRRGHPDLHRGRGRAPLAQLPAGGAAAPGGPPPGGRDAQLT